MKLCGFLFDLPVSDLRTNMVAIIRSEITRKLVVSEGWSVYLDRWYDDINKTTSLYVYSAHPNRRVFIESVISAIPTTVPAGTMVDRPSGPVNVVSSVQVITPRWPCLSFRAAPVIASE